jgi:hypothetical protein
MQCDVVKLDAVKNWPLAGKYVAFSAKDPEVQLSSLQCLVLVGRNRLPVGVDKPMLCR